MHVDSGYLTAADIARLGGKGFYLPDIETIIAQVKTEAKPGDVIAVLDAVESETRDVVAAAEAELTDIEYQNTKLLADKNVVAPNELRMAKAKLDSAKGHLALATSHRSLTEIRAHHPEADRCRTTSTDCSNVSSGNTFPVRPARS